MVQGSMVGTQPQKHRNAHRDKQRGGQSLYHGKIESLRAVGHKSDIGHERPPQRPDPTKLGLSIPVKIRLEPNVKIGMPITRPTRKEEGPRAAYLSKEDFRKYGFTEGCDGCGRLAAGMASRPHTSKCRTRMKEEMKKTPDGRKRLEETDRNIHECLESKLVEEHGAKDESERPGITRSEPEATADVQPRGSPSASDSNPSAHPLVGNSRSRARHVRARAPKRASHGR